jgi:small subunit ribosomal protein S6
MSNAYETMYILRPDLSDDAVDDVVGKYQGILRDQGGEIVETQHRGKRRLSYEIDRHREGIYIQMNFRAPGAAIAPLERSMRLSEEVIRYLTIVIDEEAQGKTLEDSAPSAAPLGS